MYESIDGRKGQFMGFFGSQNSEGAQFFPVLPDGSTDGSSPMDPLIHSFHRSTDSRIFQAFFCLSSVSFVSMAGSSWSILSKDEARRNEAKRGETRSKRRAGFGGKEVLISLKLSLGEFGGEGGYQRSNQRGNH